MPWLCLSVDRIHNVSTHGRALSSRGLGQAANAGELKSAGDVATGRLSWFTQGKFTRPQNALPLPSIYKESSLPLWLSALGNCKGRLSLGKGSYSAGGTCQRRTCCCGDPTPSAHKWPPSSCGETSRRLSLSALVVSSAEIATAASCLSKARHPSRHCVHS